MAADQEQFQASLAAVLRREIAGCRGLASVERLSGGASQETYRIMAQTGDGERPVCMRRAPGGAVPEERVAPGLAVEAQLMRLAREAGVPEPEVYYVLQPEDGLGEGFLMEWLDGETLGARIARSPELADVRPKLAYECGQVLARIHSIDIAAGRLEEHLQVHTPEQFVRQMWERYELLETPQPMIDYAARWLLDHLPAAPRRTLVHNDFRNGNFMVDEHGIKAVLDWEVAHIGDPMRDLGWICTNSWRFGVSDKPVGGFGEYADLFAGYEAESGERVDPEHVRFWEVFGSFWWAIGCLGMAEHYRTGPDQTVERPAIGRRSSECQVDCVNLLIPGPVELVSGGDLSQGDDMPRMDELLVSVRDFLRGDVMEATQGRVNFLARVAGNSLDIVLRELELGEAARAGEHARLKALLAEDASLSALRWRLTRALRDGSMALHTPGLAEHLRSTVVNQIAIDQPRYSGLQTALANAGSA
ncbi:MAG: phosphotransferase family protein [Gammaproteobacteria bacterium]|nr:phosphotransferase family protein [Gammaproteobacteria bacterium]